MSGSNLLCLNKAQGATLPVSVECVSSLAFLMLVALTLSLEAGVCQFKDRAERLKIGHSTCPQELMVHKSIIGGSMDFFFTVVVVEFLHLKQISQTVQEFRISVSFYSFALNLNSTNWFLGLVEPAMNLRALGHISLVLSSRCLLLKIGYEVRF